MTPVTQKTAILKGGYADVGLTAQFGDRWNASFYDNANFGRQDFVSHMITAGLEFRWSANRLL